jgi:hypothetical protein
MRRPKKLKVYSLSSLTRSQVGACAQVSNPAGVVPLDAARQRQDASQPPRSSLNDR